MTRSQVRRKTSSAEKKKPADEDRQLDKALEDSFPASDPPAPAQPHDKSPGSRDSPSREDDKSRRKN